MEKAKAYVQKQSEELGRPMTFCVTTFGCQMNARDSEKLCGILEKIGYVEAPEEEADFIIFNTCTVRENANTRVYGRLGQLKPRKKKNPHMMIGLCGCMMQEPEVVEIMQCPWLKESLMHTIKDKTINYVFEKTNGSLYSNQKYIQTKYTQIKNIQIKNIFK